MKLRCSLNSSQCCLSPCFEKCLQCKCPCFGSLPWTGIFGASGRDPGLSGAVATFPEQKTILHSTTLQMQLIRLLRKRRRKPSEKSLTLLRAFRRGQSCQPEMIFCVKKLLSCWKFIPMFRSKGGGHPVVCPEKNLHPISRTPFPNNLDAFHLFQLFFFRGTWAISKHFQKLLPIFRGFGGLLPLKLNHRPGF